MDDKSDLLWCRNFPILFMYDIIRVPILGAEVAVSALKYIIEDHFRKRDN